MRGGTTRIHVEADITPSAQGWGEAEERGGISSGGALGASAQHRALNLKTGRVQWATLSPIPQR